MNQADKTKGNQMQQKHSRNILNDAPVHINSQQINQNQLLGSYSLENQEWNPAHLNQLAVESLGRQNQEVVVEQTARAKTSRTKSKSKKRRGASAIKELRKPAMQLDKFDKRSQDQEKSKQKAPFSNSNAILNRFSQINQLDLVRPNTQLNGAQTERTYLKDSPRKKNKRTKSKTAKRPLSQMAKKVQPLNNKKVLNSQQKIKDLMLQRHQESGDRYKADNPQIDKVKSVIKKQIQAKYLTKAVVETKWVGPVSCPMRQKVLKKPTRSKSKKSKQPAQKQVRIKKSGCQPSFITDINGNKLVNLNTNQEIVENNEQNVNQSRDNFELLIQDQRSDQMFDQHNMAQQYQNMSSILHESTGGEESQEISNFNHIPQDQLVNGQYQSISKYNKYLNNSQNAIQWQDQLTGNGQGQQTNQSQLFENDENTKSEDDPYTDGNQSALQDSPEDIIINNAGLINLQEDNEVAQTEQTDKNTDRNSAKVYISNLFRQSINVNNPEFMMQLNQSNINGNQDHESNDDHNSQRPLKQPNENYVSVQNIYGVPDSTGLSYKKQQHGQLTQKKNEDHSKDTIQDQNIEELRSRIHSTFDDLENRLHNASPIPQFLAKDYSDDDSKNFLDDVAASNFDIKDPMLRELEMRAKEQTLKPLRLLQNDVKGSARIPMTSHLRLSLEQVRQKQKYQILQQEKDRLKKQKEDEEDLLMTQNSIHKNVQNQKINVNNRDFQDRIRIKHDRYFNLRKLNENKSLELPLEQTHQPKINKNTSKIIEKANQKYRERSMQGTIGLLGTVNKAGLLNTEALINQSFEEWQKAKDIKFSGTQQIKQGSLTDRQINRFGEPMSQTINLNKLNALGGQKQIQTRVVSQNDRASKFSQTIKTDNSKEKTLSSKRLNLTKKSQQSSLMNQPSAKVDKKFMEKMQKIHKDKQEGKITFDDAVKGMNEVFQNARREDVFKSSEAERIAQQKKAVQQQYIQGSKGSQLYAKNNKFKKYLNSGGAAAQHQKQFSSKRSTSKKGAKIKNNRLEVKVAAGDQVTHAEIFDDERAANSGFHTPLDQVGRQVSTGQTAAVDKLKNQLFSAVKQLYTSKIPDPPSNAPIMPPLPQSQTPVLTTEQAPQAPPMAASIPTLDPRIVKRNSIMVPLPPQIPQLKSKLADAIKRLYLSKIPPLPSNAPALPPLPKPNAQKLTSDDAPCAPAAASLVPQLDPAIIKRNSLLIPPPPQVPLLKLKLAEAIKKMYLSKIPPPPSNAPVLPPLPKQESLQELTKEGAPLAPITSQKIPALDKDIIKRNSILVPLPPKVPELQNKLALAILKLYKSKIPEPPKASLNIPAPPNSSNPVLTSEKAPKAPENARNIPALNPEIIKRNSLLVPAPPKVPELQNKLALAIMKLYKSKIPAPPAISADMPPPPLIKVDQAKLTSDKAPEPPSNAKLIPALDHQIIKRNSILIPPPPSVPQLQNKLAEAIKNLYQKKIPQIPKNTPILPPLPLNESAGPSLTKQGAPQAPQNVAVIPKLDPAIVKRNSILIPPPPEVPQLQLKLAEAIKKLYQSKIPPPPSNAPILPPLPKEESAPSLTNKSAPAPPKNVALIPALDPAIVKRNSLLVPAPPKVPELQNKLALAILKLYKSKIPPPPNNLPQIAPPVSHAGPQLTKEGAPQAPTVAVKVPALDPAVVKRNSILIPAPPSIPVVKQTLDKAIKDMFAQIAKEANKTAIEELIKTEDQQEY